MGCEGVWGLRMVLIFFSILCFWSTQGAAAADFLLNQSHIVRLQLEPTRYQPLCNNWCWTVETWTGTPTGDWQSYIIHHVRSWTVATKSNKKNILPIYINGSLPEYGSLFFSDPTVIFKHAGLIIVAIRAGICLFRSRSTSAEVIVNIIWADTIENMH